MKKGCICEGIIEKVEFPNRGKATVEGETVIEKMGYLDRRFVFDSTNGENVWKADFWRCWKSRLWRDGSRFAVFSPTVEGACTRQCPMKSS